MTPSIGTYVRIAVVAVLLAYIGWLNWSKSRTERLYESSVADLKVSRENFEAAQAINRQNAEQIERMGRAESVARDISTAAQRRTESRRERTVFVTREIADARSPNQECAIDGRVVLVLDELRARAGTAGSGQDRARDGEAAGRTPDVPSGARPERP